MKDIKSLVESIIAHQDPDKGVKQIMSMFNIDKTEDEACINCNSKDLDSLGDYESSNKVFGKEYRCNDCDIVFELDDSWSTDDNHELLNDYDNTVPLRVPKYDKGFTFKSEGKDIVIMDIVYQSKEYLTYLCEDYSSWTEEEIDNSL